VIDALGRPQTVLLLGGTSEIGIAIIDRYLDQHPLRVVLAGRPSPRLEAAAALLADRGAAVETVKFDATDQSSHQDTLKRIFAAKDIDLAIVAFGVLADQRAASDPELATHVATVNFTAAVSVGVFLAGAMRNQGHGVIVALSSIAGERPRPSNFVYGATKAGMTAFYDGLADSLVGSGVRVVVVRAGHVRTRMTAHLTDPPLATTPQAVAAAITDAVWHGRSIVWAPRTAQLIAWIIRRIPRSMLRKLPY
jgi:decaprenylphospho-beta-D-erythro-pentofuranosid-2-ulose 2-reductase